MLTVIGVCATLYVYCVTTTIKNIVRVEDMHSQMSELSLALGQKEFDVIKLKNNVSLSYAETLGFVPVTSETYITKQSVGFLTENSNEI
jgi:hypothetical protein